MNAARFGSHVGCSMIAAVMMCAVAPRALAQNQHAHAADARALTLVDVVREATERFKNVADARKAGYEPAFGCVSGAEYGAMGMHFINFPRVFDVELDAAKPEIVIYEPLPNGRLRLVGADYLVLAADWDARHPTEPPQIMGQLMHLFESPNRFGLPSFYTLHVWAWKDNPTGTFANWHSNVKCDAMTPQP